ncbi:MAG TPA: D-erythronate dehydrogenase [Tepidisphaeraceae bacterium]|jgi:nucleoside-diphosphate-sugar epimerase
MNVTVTGAGGFIGRRLVRQLLDRGTVADANGNPTPITKIIACDLALDGLPPDSRVERVEADSSDSEVISRIVTNQTGAVFHLAAVVSVGAEEDFDLGMRVNLDTTRALLETCRRIGKVPSFVFASSVAVYGGEMPPILEDHTAPTPQTSYGTQKAICELLISDYSRRGFVDGRSLRLPTVVVRPGKPNKAASTFASSIIRDPLEGREVACPVPADTSMFLLSPRKVVEAFIAAQATPSTKWGMIRALQLPGLTLSVCQMLAALEEVAGPKAAARVKFEPNARIEKIVYGWPTAFRATRALKLGFTPDASMHDIIKAFIADDLNGKFVA